MLWTHSVSNRINGRSTLAVGFGIITFGSLLAGIADQLLLVDATTALVIEHTLTAVGFCLIAYSLYRTRDQPFGQRLQRLNTPL